jgi:two-component system, OmpR family, sensor histidine kinase MtrB
MRRRTPRLRTILASITVVTTVLALGVAGALLMVTSYLHRSTTSLAASVESVRLAEEAEIALLLHARATDPVERGDIERDLRAMLTDARRYITNDEEAQIVSAAQADAEAYMTAANDSNLTQADRGRPLEQAYRALDALVGINQEQAREAQEAATRLDESANAIAIAAGVILLAVAVALLWWLEARAFRPVLSLASAMDRFGRGDRQARSEETGPAELADMARRFNEMAAALGAQREAQMTFLAGVAHDLRNPLGALRMSVSTFGPERPLPPEHRVRRTLELVGRQVTRLERMIEDLLDMAHIESGQLDLRMGEHDARDLVRGVVQLFDATSPQHPLSVDMPRAPVVLHCDPVRIEQVVTNLVSNAIKYSPSGGRVEVTLEAEDGGVLLAVTDHGIGLSDEDRSRLFEPFRRVGLSREAIPGVGLGLYVVHRIVAAHGGRMAVESELGRGSTFRVWLPSDASSVSTSTRSTRPDDHARGAV